jgi:hypothetical protein
LGAKHRSTGRFWSALIYWPTPINSSSWSLHSQQLLTKPEPQFPLHEEFVLFIFRCLLTGLAPEINRGYNEDLLDRIPVRTGHSSEPIVNYDDNHFDRRLPPQSSSNREYEEDQRKVHFRNGRRRMYGKDGHSRGSGIRNGVFDEGSSVSSDQRYGGSSEFVKMPPDYLRAPQKYLRTPPEFKTPPDYHRTTPEFKTPPDFTKTPPEFAKTHSHAGHQSHSNQLLNLRAALNEKELQLVELREQHITILNRAAESRQNWEEALKSKDRVIVQLQKTLQHKKTQLDRFYFCYHEFPDSY